MPRSLEKVVDGGLYNHLLFMKIEGFAGHGKK